MRLSGYINCITPLAHGADEKSGIDTKFRRIKMLYNGDVEHVPVLSGNAIRGVLRRIAAKDFLETIEYKEMSDKLYYMLFSGGSLEKGSKQDYIEIGDKRTLRNMIPFISLLGCSFKNQIIEGKLKVGMGVPIAAETIDYTGENSALSVWDLCDEIFYTRRDDLEDKEENKEQKQQMKYTVECLAAGTRLKHSFDLNYCNEIEIACFYSILNKFNETPFLGGLSSKGHGHVNLVYTIKEFTIYYDYLKENKEIILNYLKGL